MIEINKSIPIPSSKIRREYPYEKMEIGDSFLIESVSLQSVCNANYRAFKRGVGKFIAKKEGKGIRVWRIL